MPAANYEESFEESYAELGQEESSGSSGWGNIIRTLQRRLPLVAATTALTTGAAYLVSSTLPPTFQGSFQLQVEPASAEDRITDPFLALTGQKISDRTVVDYPTQVAILQSPRILEGVIETLQVEDNLDLSVADFLQNLEIEQVNKARIIQVSYTGTDGEVVGKTLNRLSEAYLNYSLNERKTRGKAGVEFIEARAEELESRSEALREELEAIQRQYAFFDPEIESEALATQMRELAAQKAEIGQQLSEQRQIAQSLQTKLGLSSTQALDALALSEDQQYQNLSESLFEVNQQIALAQARFKSDSPTVTELVAQREQLAPLLQERAVQLLGGRATDNSSLLAIQDETRSGLAQNLIQATTQIGLLEDREQFIRNRLAGVESRMAEFPEVTRRYNNTRDKLNFVREALADLNAQQQNLEVVAAQSEIPWELISQPLVLDVSSSAKKLLALGVAGGLFLGVGLAIALDRMENVSYDEEDVAGLSNLLSTIPDYTGERPLLSWMVQPPHAIERAKENDPDFSEFLEAFNSLYARLLLDNSDRLPLRTLGVSSAGTGDGKTTIAVYLAYAMASAGKNVLLVDANLRSPSLHERLGLHNEQGLKQLLDNPGQALKQKSLLQPLPASKNLRVLTSGGVAPNASQLLASEGMSTLMQKFRDKFDFVIYDTSRLRGYADAQYIADRTNGLLVVTQLRRSKRSDFQESLETLQAVRLNILGTIANAAHPKRSKNYASGGLDGSDEADELAGEEGFSSRERISELREVEETFSEIRKHEGNDDFNA